MGLLRAALLFPLLLAGCNSSSAPSYNYNPTDAGGGGGGGLGDGGRAPDLASASPMDLSVKAPPDLAQPPPPPDLAQRPPDLTIACAPGHYSGPVMVNATVASVPTTLTGTVSLLLGPAQNGVLPIVTGSMSGMTPQQGGTASATVTGALDCNSLRLVNGKLTNGKVAVMQLGINLSFTGTLDAAYDPAMQAFVNGTLTASGLSITGMGTWSADWTGP